MLQLREALEAAEANTLANITKEYQAKSNDLQEHGKNLGMYQTCLMSVADRAQAAGDSHTSAQVLVQHSELVPALKALQRQQPPLDASIDSTLAVVFDADAAVATIQRQVTLLAAVSVPDHCEISAGGGSIACLVGHEASFVVTVRDKNRQPVPGFCVGRDLKAMWQLPADRGGGDDSSAVIATAMQFAAVPDKPGQWRASYRWPEQTPHGPRPLVVKLRGVELPRSPLSIQALAVQLDHCEINAGGGSVECKVAGEAVIIVTIRNMVRLPVIDAVVGSLLSLKWDGGDDGPAGTVATNSAIPDGSWRITYRWPEGTQSGPRQCAVQLFGQHLPRSPLTVQVKPLVCTLTFLF
jgi:hypothetical protein